MEARLVLLRSFTNLLPESKNTRHDFRPDGSCGLLRTLSLLRDVSSPPFLFMFLPPFFITCVSTRLDKPVFSFGADDGCDSFGFEWLSTWMGSPAFCPPWKPPMSPRHSSSYAICRKPEKGSRCTPSIVRSEVSLMAPALRGFIRDRWMFL